MCGLKRGRQREREERTRECLFFGIRASTGEPQWMGDTLDILSCFTTHSSDCFFTSWYVWSVWVCDICISVCPCLYINLHILYVLSCMYDHVNIVHACTCVLMFTSMYVSAASSLTDCLSWTPVDYLLF